jgi:hypothetical protein
MAVSMCDPGFKQRCVHHLPLPAGLARMQGCEYAHAGENAGGDVSDGRSYFHWRRPPAFPCNAHQSGHALRNQVEAAAIGIWPGPSETGDRAIDQLRIQRMQRVVAEAHLFHRPAAVILDQNVSILQQT